MKIRLGYVSNSSSSSFLIPINALTESQVLMMQDYVNVTENWCKYNNMDLYPEGWDITVNEKCVYGWTIMDNFDMHFFLMNIIGVKEKYVHWGDDYTDNNIDLDKLNREILQEERKEKLDNIEKH